MLNKIFSIATVIIFAIIGLGLFILLFSIGLIALFYIIVIGGIIWAIRRLYYFFKGQKPPTIMEQYYSYTVRYREPKDSKSSRIINYDDFKDK